MKMIRNGKIARLPAAIREQLNRRLADHESSTPLLGWLNALPEVQTVLAAEFAGKAVTKFNLHQWRHGGYQQWLQLQEAQAMMEQIGPEVAGLKAAAQEPMTETLAAWATARYLVAAKNVSELETDTETAWRRARELCREVMVLRRQDLQAQRLEFEQEKFVDRANRQGMVAGDDFLTRMARMIADGGAE